jgi:hypothetical protein
VAGKQGDYGEISMITKEANFLNFNNKKLLGYYNKCKDPRRKEVVKGVLIYRGVIKEPGKLV